MIFDLADCEEIVGYSFRDKQLLRTAFTHTSYANEHNSKSYERMEYLGDALLDFIVAEYLYRKYPGVGEGELTTRRAKLVSKQPLKEIAEELKLGQYVLLGEGGEKSGERQNDKILSSLIESALAAVYLDGGMDPARRFVEERILCHADRILRSTEDYKTELQEYVQKSRLGALSYEEAGKSGPDHSPVFEARVLVNGAEIAVGKGGKKQQAEQDAARLALSVLRKAGGENQPSERQPREEKNDRRGNKPRRKEKHPKETRVLSLVSDYGEKKQEQPQKPQKNRADRKKEGFEKGQKTDKTAGKAEKSAQNPKKQQKKKSPVEPQKEQKKADGKQNKPAKAEKKAAGKAEKKGKKPFFGFVGNSQKGGGDGTPLL